MYYDGKTKGIFCTEHKDQSMINVVDKTCLFEGCTKQPCFNYDGEQKGVFCAEHKQQNMVDVKNKKCLFKDCNKQSCFNYSGETKGIFCFEHKKDNMVDVKNKKCLTCACCASYGIPGNTPTVCAQHKEDGMISHPKTKCKTANCKEIAIYALTSKKAIHCEMHKEHGEINIIERICTGCGYPNILNENNECTCCDPKHFNQFRLGKQLQVKKWLDINEFKYESYDRAVNYVECGDKERPDFVFEAHNGSCKIILEVDEHRHRGRQEQCECARMVTVSQANGIPTLFIRYNPDEFKVNKRKKNPDHNARMKILRLVLDTALNIDPEDIIGYCCIKWLYFDDFDESAIFWHIITPFDQ